MATTNVKANKDKTFNKPNMQSAIGSTSKTSKIIKVPKVKKVTFNNQDTFDNQTQYVDLNQKSNLCPNPKKTLDKINNTGLNKTSKLKKPPVDISESEHSNYSSDDSDDSDASDDDSDDQYDDSNDTNSHDNSHNDSKGAKYTPLITRCAKNPNKDHISNFDQSSELMNMFNFKTSAASCIRSDVMLFAIKNIKRSDSVLKLTNYLPIGIADKLEQGILEYSMIQISNENPDVVHFLLNTYHTVVNDICLNLDTKNERINNQTLAPSLIDGSIDPFLVAFMSPSQLNPGRWIKYLETRRVAEEANDNKKVTDIYKCRRCGARKSTTHQMQTRSADESMTIFVTCVVCYNTFTTQ